MIIDGSAATHDLTETFDVAIVGSGAGGAVLARELAEGGMKVAVVEEGGLHLTTSHRDMSFEAVARMYRDHGFTATFGRPAAVVPLGCALGGTTVINSGTCFRTPHPVFEQWNRQHGLNELREEEFSLWFDRIEKTINVVEAETEIMGRSNTLFHELLAKGGRSGHPLMRNTKDCEGCGFCCYGCPSGSKQSMDVSYLPLAFKAGAVAYTNARVTGLISEAGSPKTITGLEALFLGPDHRPTGRRLRIRAARTILAAGTISSPVLLKSSGIARRNRHCGGNLSLHPATKVFAEFDEKICGWEGIPQAYAYEGLKDQGITFEGIFVPPDVAAMMAPYCSRKLHPFMRRYANMATFGFLINDSSRGRVVRLPWFGPAIFYSLNRQDVEKFRRAIVFLARVFLEGGAKAVHPLVHGFNEIRSEADLHRLETGRMRAEDIHMMAFHPLGTCRMAPTPDQGVVDQQNRVFGTEGLYVCDGSVIPTALGVNPQITIMAFATRLAQLLLK